MKRELNDAWLRSVKPPATGRLEIRDTEVVGLVLRVTPNGAMTWSARTRTNDGKQTRPKLGSYPALGLAAARKAARLAIGGILGGADPVKAKQEAREARRHRLAEATVAERLADWQATRTNNPDKPWSNRYATEVERICQHDLRPRLGKRPLSDTTRVDWTSLVADKRKSAPAMAASLYRVVSSFLNHAEAEGWIAAPLLPRKGAAKLAPLVKPRARVLSDAELVELWRATEAEAPKARAFVRLLVLTAAREVEVAGMMTGELNPAAGRWNLPGARCKNGQSYTVPLGPLALAEVAAVWPTPADEPDDEWCLLGKMRDSGFSGFSRLKARIDATIAAGRAAGPDDTAMPGWRWHDLRRTARTGMTKLGVRRDHAEAAINHISGMTKLERTYEVYDFAEEIVAALHRWQAHVAGLVTAQPTAEVVTLTGHRARKA
jgi:integrase